MSKKIFSFLDRGISWIELFWKLFGYLLVLVGGSTTGILAKASEIFKNYSLFCSVVVGIATSFILALLLYLLSLSRKKNAEALYLNIHSQPTSTINPLSDSFDSKIINVADLEMPLNSPHKNKLFKRCEIVGPGTIFIKGGTSSHTKFLNCGDVILAPIEMVLTGVIILENCTLDQCKLINITLITVNTPDNVRGFKTMGARLFSAELKH
ncbi:hypothetical protein LH92_10465 [Acinetobacter baumannii]|uniref:hypothetical protein n=1 Tax=Acinetobacter baumannii TaxID=470 RepID=UPI0005139796|nr:hypothetical protein [Acinetobacter baumannii]KGF60294.1 hypothetical protein LH92_10465 [Acinetobacter baumannii]